MQFDWTTFALEILNFLVLVWLLKRFLYRPVLKAIMERRSRIEQSLADSEQKRTEAAAFRAEYEQRLVAWEQEKEQLRARMRQEVNEERARLLEEVQASVEAERDKARALESRRVADLTRQAESAAYAHAARFAALLLGRLAGPDLEGKLVEMVLNDLQGLSEAQRQALREAGAKTDAPVAVVSAYPVDQRQREALRQGLERVAGRALQWTWSENRELMAGLRVSMGPWILHANLQDELKSFSEASHG